MPYGFDIALNSPDVPFDVQASGQTVSAKTLATTRPNLAVDSTQAFPPDADNPTARIVAVVRNDGDLPADWCRISVVLYDQDGKIVDVLTYLVRTGVAKDSPQTFPLPLPGIQTLPADYKVYVTGFTGAPPPQPTAAA